jgi:chromate reductase
MARNIALIVGSLRKGSYTRMVANALVELAPDSLHLENIEIGKLPLYNQDLDPDSPPREWVEFRDRVRPMDGVLIASPEYNRSIPGGLKNAIDVGSRPYGKSVFAGKPCGIISASPGIYGGFGANHHLRQCCVFLDMPVMQQPEAYVSRVDKALDAQGKITNDEVRKLLQSFITSYADWVERFVSAEKKRSAA